MPAGRARPLGWHGRFAGAFEVEETRSTNADLLDAARRGEDEQVLIARHQTAGRGRLDRQWEAPPGASLLMSVLVREPFPACGPHLVTTALGLAAVEVIGPAVGLKWPNDVVARRGPQADRKVGGILAERHGSALVVGIGLNLSWPDGFPPALADIATTLELLGARPDRLELARRLVTRFEELAAELPFSATACELLHERHREECVTLGRKVRVDLGGGRGVTGTATDLGAGGELIVADGLGNAHEIAAGDVVHVRPAGGGHP